MLLVNDSALPSTTTPDVPLCTVARSRWLGDMRVVDQRTKPPSSDVLGKCGPENAHANFLHCHCGALLRLDGKTTSSDTVCRASSFLGSVCLPPGLLMRFIMLIHRVLSELDGTEVSQLKMGDLHLLSPSCGSV